MNPKQTILLASMTLALCACPLSSGDDVESKIHHSDDTRLVGKRDPDKLTDLTQELAKRKADEASKVKAEVQKAQMKIFADAQASGKPEDVANALTKFESADETRKKMTNSPEILQTYSDMKEKCLKEPECRKAYLPEEENKEPDGKDPKDPKDPVKPNPEGVPEDKDRTEVKPLDLDSPDNDLKSKIDKIPDPATKDLVENAFKQIKTNPDSFAQFLSTISDDTLKPLSDNHNEFIFKDSNDKYRHIYKSKNAVFNSVTDNDNRSLSINNIIPIDKKAFENKNSAQDTKLIYNGDALTWSGIPIKDITGEFEPHLLKGDLTYTLAITSGNAKGSGFITNLKYAGKIKNTNGALSVSNQDGVFKLGEVTFGVKGPNLVDPNLVDSNGTKTDKTLSSNTYGEVTWIQKNGDFIPNNSKGQYVIDIFGEKGEHLVGKATIDESDIILTGETTK